MKDLSDELYSLVDRLRKCCEIKYPNRKWTNRYYYECLFQWKDKVSELKGRVIKLESELND